MATLISSNSRTPAGLSLALAQTPAERQQAHELQKNVYISKGLLREGTVKPPLLPQASAPGSAIFVAKENDAIVGTITFYMDSVIGLPMDDIHRDEVDDIRSRFTRVAEIGGLAVREDRRGCGIPTMLFLATFRWALTTNVQCIVACVNPSYRRVYSKLLLFKVLGECKQHFRFLAAPSIPIGLDLTAARTRYRGHTALRRMTTCIGNFCASDTSHMST
jgi:GNAT superfamily N-acetyltransferase